ncbi:MAG: DMT family transporter [Clostridia bacterium]|nr:DMT family transporter [Clostridia bacterium]
MECYMNKKTAVTGNLLALYPVLIWGTTFIITKKLMQSFNAAEILCTRFAIAFLLLALARLIKGKEPLPEKASKKDELFFVAAGVIGLFLYGVLEIVSMQYTYASNTSTIVCTNPFFIALFAVIFLKEKRPGINFIIGFAVAITGIVLISFNGATEFGLNPLGDFLALICAVTWGMNTNIAKKVTDKGYGTLYVTRHVYFWGTLTMAISLPFFGFEGSFSRFTDPKTILYLLFLGIVASCTCFLAWNKATAMIGPVRSGVYIYAIPVVTIIFSSIFLNEKINLASAMGIVLVITGTVISSLNFKKKEKTIE